MSRRIHILLIFSLLCMIIVTAGCSPKKKITKTSLREFTAASLIREVEKNEFDFDRMMAKISLKIETDDKNFTVKGQLRMMKDSILWTSISLPLGMEVMRAMVTPDSIFVMNRNDKTYLSENINVLSDISPLMTTIEFMQAVLIGNDLNLRESDNYKVKIEDGQYNLLISKRLKKALKHNDEEWKVILKDLWIDPQLFKITKYHIREYNDSKRKIELQYSDFVEVNGKYIPTNISINVHGDMHLKANISYSNITTDDNIEFIYKVPQKYNRIFK